MCVPVMTLSTSAFSFVLYRVWVSTVSDLRHVKHRGMKGCSSWQHPVGQWGEKQQQTAPCEWMEVCAEEKQEAGCVNGQGENWVLPFAFHCF